MKLHADIETFSECDLKEAGVYRYAEHPSTSINCLGYTFDGGPVHQWLPFESTPELEAILAEVRRQKPGTIHWTGFVTPPGLREHINAQGEFLAHNAQFERVVLNGEAGNKIGFPSISIDQTTCTEAKAAASGLQRALADVAAALGTHKKSEAGRIEMLQLAKPRKPTKADPSTRWTFANAPEKWIAMLCYNIDDVLAEREVDDALPDLIPSEQRIYHIDQRINEVGWAVDLAAVNNILFVVEQYKAQLAVEFAQLTEDWMGNGLSPTQREKVADWVRANGYASLPDLTADTVRLSIKRTDIPANVKRVLVIYSTYGAKSVSKLQAMLNAVCADGRLRGLFIFHGATPGRWVSVIVQLQNMMRPVIKDPNTAIEAFAERNVDYIRFLYPDVDPMKVAGSCIRGCLVAREGHDLVFPDYSGVEDRANAWFFDEEWVLDAYRDYDAGKGRHLYSLTVCRAFGLDINTFSDDDPRRQLGKVKRLAMGYEGGVNAYVQMAETYQIDLDDMAKTVIPLLPDDALEHAEWMHKNHPFNSVSEDIETACNGLKFLYRQSHPRIKQGWANLKEAAEKAVEFKGETFWLPNKKLAFKVEEYKGREWLCMRIPSGRKIKFYRPRWEAPRESERWINNELVPYTIPGVMHYWGVDRDSHQWRELQTYGGKLDQNADEGFCRDMLCNAMINMEEAGYVVVGSEHDKLIIEVPVDSGSVDEIKQLMLKQPAYTAGLPLTTDGKRQKRYGK